MNALRLLSGDAYTFVEKVWASQVHVHHADADDLVGLLSVDDVDHLLTSTALRAPALRIAKNGKVSPAATFTRSASLAGQPLTGLVDARKVFDLFDEGATVVLQGLHRYWPPLTRLVRDLELTLGHPCQANAYLTPPGSQGFAVHSDNHDVFVFQTHGSKQWEVHDESGVRPVLLEPGISMYLPSGTPHAACAQETVSLHVTVGINQVTWRQMLMRVTEDVLADPAYDAAVPAGFLADRAPFERGLAARLDDLGRRLASRDAGAVTAEHAERFLTARTPALRGGLRDRLALPELTDDTLLQRRPTAACVLVAAGDRLRVLLGDREIRMPARLEEAMRLVAERTQFCASDLSAWLDAESRLVLVRRLVREGLLRVAD